jgi:hypothetical protein
MLEEGGKMKHLLLSLTIAMTLLAMSAPTAWAQNYVPMDPSTLPQVPGCAWYPDPQYSGMYQIWCGSDELGWYSPYEWYQLTGIWPPDYGLGGG